MNNLDSNKIKENYKNLKRDIIAENLKLDKVDERLKDSGYSFYFVIIYFFDIMFIK